MKRGRRQRTGSRRAACTGNGPGSQARSAPDPAGETADAGHETAGGPRLASKKTHPAEALQEESGENDRHRRRRCRRGSTHRGSSGRTRSRRHRATPSRRRTNLCEGTYRGAGHGRHQSPATPSFPTRKSDPDPVGAPPAGRAPGAQCSSGTKAPNVAWMRKLDRPRPDFEIDDDFLIPPKREDTPATVPGRDQRLGRALRESHRTDPVRRGSGDADPHDQPPAVRRSAAADTLVRRGNIRQQALQEHAGVRVAGVGRSTGPEPDGGVRGVRQAGQPERPEHAPGSDRGSDCSMRKENRWGGRRPSWATPFQPGSSRT